MHTQNQWHTAARTPAKHSLIQSPDENRWVFRADLNNAVEEDSWREHDLSQSLGFGSWGGGDQHTQLALYEGSKTFCSRFTLFKVFQM